MLEDGRSTAAPRAPLRHGVVTRGLTHMWRRHLWGRKSSRELGASLSLHLLCLLLAAHACEHVGADDEDAPEQLHGLDGVSQYEGGEQRGK